MCSKVEFSIYDKFWIFLIKHSHYSDSQIMAILKQAELSGPVPELCREHGMATELPPFYRRLFSSDLYIDSSGGLNAFIH
jgi:hypothetical protein